MVESISQNQIEKIKMRTARKAVFSCIISVLYVLAPLPVSPETSPRVHVNKKGISGSSVEAQGILQGNIDDLWVILTDYPGTSAWIKNIIQNRVISREGNRITVHTIAAVGPLNTEYTCVMNENIRDYELRWKQKDGPFTVNEGKWKLKRLSENKTHVFYEASMEHPLLPSWAKTRLLNESIPEMFRGLQETINSKKAAK